MYHPQVISRNLEIVISSGGPNGSPLPFELQYYSKDYIQQCKAHLTSLINKDLWEDKGKLEYKRPLAPDEIQFIQNEQLLCTFDYLYFARNYAKILHWNYKGLDLYEPSKAQLIINDVRAEMELRSVGIWIIQLKTRQIGACLHPDTLVLTTNLVWKRIDDLVIGEEILSVDEFAEKGRGLGRKMQTAKVEAKFEVYEPSYKITLSNGQELIATTQHKFLSQVRWNNVGGAHGTQWRQVRKMQVGDTIRVVTRTWASQLSYEDGWMGGMIDGEGSFRYLNRDGVELAISQVEGPVLDRLEQYLQTRGYNYRKDIDYREAGTSSKLGNKPVAKLVIARMGEIFRLLGQTRPSRFLDKHWWINKNLPGKQKAGDTAWASVIAIEPLGPQRMIDLQTSESTYIANGFVSHNSTDDQVVGAHRILFHENTRGLTASSKEDKTRELAEKCGIVIRNCPFYLLPTITRENQLTHKLETSADFKLYDSGEVYYTCDSMNTKMRLQYGNQTGGVGRGETPTWAHITEIPDFLNPKEDIQNSLLKSMHNDPSFFFVLESTGKYKGDYYNDLWDDSTQYYFQGKSRFFPLFLGWYIADDIYPTKADVRAFMPLDYIPTERSELIAKQAEHYVHSNDLLNKHLGKDWRMTLEQKWFYEWDRQQAERENRLATWLCEMPSTPEQAFAVRGSGMFDAEFIEQLREKASPIEFIFGISSDNYPINFKHRFDSSIIDSSLTSIPVVANYSENKAYHYSFQLQPLRPKSLAAKALSGLLLVWELPDEDEEYEITLDGAEGIGQDYTSITVIAKGDYLTNTIDREVAVFYSNQISTAESFPFFVCISSLYVYVRNNRIQEPKKVIERPRGGTALIQECIKAGLKNYYINRDLAMRQLQDPSKKLGWEPNQQQRDAMLGDFLQAVKDDEFRVNSPFTIDCLATFGWNPGRRKMEALAGHHDDPIISAGMGFFSINSFDIKGRDPGAASRRQQKQLNKLLEAKRYEYNMGDMARPVAARKSYSFWDNYNGEED